MTTVPVHIPFDESDQFGGPAAPGFIPLSVPEISGNEWKYIKDCLDTGWVSSAGPFVTRFEREFASYVGTGNAVAVTNGTAALHVALRLAGVEAGDEVLVSNLTFVASVNAITYCQAHPVLVDADRADWQIDVEKIAGFLDRECVQRGGACVNKRSGRRVRAILPVHILGLACRIDQIVDIARRYDLRVVEDAAEAVGVRYKGRHVGTFGDVGVFSFNGNKIMTTGGGGMVVTGDSDRAEYARYLTTQAKDDSIEHFHREVGYNYRLTNVQSAMGVAQLERIGEFIQRKRAIAEAYDAAFLDLQNVTRMPRQADVEATYWLYTVLLSPETTYARRKEVVDALNAQGIGARPLWHTIHDLPPYRACQTVEIEHSVRLYERGVSLPSSVGLTTDDQRKCVEAFRKIIQGGNAAAELRERSPSPSGRG